MSPLAPSRAPDWRSALRVRRADLLIFVIYLAIGALLDARGIDHVSPDTHTYVEPAKGLLAGVGFATRAADGTVHPEFIRTPLYPLYLSAFLGAFGSAGLMASIWFQRIAWGLIVVLGFPGIGAAERERDRALCALGKGACLLSPQVLVNASLLLTDIPFACLVALGLRATDRAVREGGGLRAAAAGLLLGLATLTRPAGKLLPVVLALVWLGGLWWWRRFAGTHAPRRRGIAAVAVFLAVAAMLPLGWSARNWSLSGHFTLTPFSGASLAWHRQTLIGRMVREGVAFGGPLEDRYARMVAEQDNALLPLWSLKADLGLDDFAGDALAGRVGAKAIRSHPVLYARDSLYSMVNIVMAPADAQMLCGVLFRWGRAVNTPLATAVRERVWSTLVFQALTRGANLLAFLILPGAACLYAGRRGWLRLADGLYLGAAFYFVVATSLVVSTYGRFFLPVLPSVAYVLSALRRTG